MLQTSTIRFLQQLSKNNNKEWFDKNRSMYDAAKKDFVEFIDNIIKQHGKNDPSIAALQGKDCIFRINRDVRFSKDKSPYKKNIAASIDRGGKKSIYAGYYIHIQPGESFVGGGLWMPMPDELRKVRQEIDYGFDEFKAITGNKKFKAIYGKLDESEEFKLSRPPKGYDESNPAIEYLKLKSFIAIAPLKDEDITSKGLTKKVLDAFSAVQPLLNFINRAIEG